MSRLLILANSSLWSDLRCELADLRAEISLVRLLQLLKVKFDPDQPRDDQGRWTDGAQLQNVITATDFSLVGVRRSEAECWLKYQVDMLRCQAEVRTPARAVCRSQAMERYAACLTDRPIPPLSF